jgi:hypothetical protein
MPANASAMSSRLRPSTATKPHGSERKSDGGASRFLARADMRGGRHRAVLATYSPNAPTGPRWQSLGWRGHLRFGPAQYVIAASLLSAAAVAGVGLTLPSIPASSPIEWAAPKADRVHPSRPSEPAPIAAVKSPAPTPVAAAPPSPPRSARPDPPPPAAITALASATQRPVEPPKPAVRAEDNICTRHHGHRVDYMRSGRPSWRCVFP